MNGLRKHYSIIISSLKSLNSSIAYFILFDVLIVISFAFFGNLWYINFENKAMELGTIALPDLSSDAIDTLDPQALENSAEAMLSSISFFYVSISFLLIIFLLIWSLFKGLIWTRIYNIKLSLRLYYKFFILNIITLIIWIIPALLIFILFKMELVPYIILGLFLVGLYFTSLSYVLFFRSQKLNSVLNGFHIGITNIKFFLLPITLIILALFLISMIFRQISFLPVYLFTIISAIVFFLFLAFIRYYIIEIMNNLNK